jgi:hypothetical protein
MRAVAIAINHTAALVRRSSVWLTSTRDHRLFCVPQYLLRPVENPTPLALQQQVGDISTRDHSKDRESNTYGNVALAYAHVVTSHPGSGAFSSRVDPFGL